MRIEGLALARRGDDYELSATIAGLRIWLRTSPETPPWERVDPFVPAALLAAMAAGQPLEVPAETPVSTRLLDGIQRAQEILHAWNPRLRRIPVAAVSTPARPQRGEAAAFFSCGVDSLYTVWKHGDQISRLLLIQGLEISLLNETLFAQAVSSARSFAEETGRDVVLVRTNLRRLGDAHRLDIHLFHGALLAGAALVTGHARTYVPSSSTYAHLAPWGSHALLDAHWSTEACELVHDGAEAPRTEKLATIARASSARRVLRVCLADTAAYNCGRCEKCLRTMVTLHLLGVEAPTFPPFPSVAALRQAPVDPDAIDLCANIELADKVGHREIARALRACLRRHRLRRLAREADALLLRGLLRRAYRWLRPLSAESSLIGCVPRPD